MAPLGNWAQLPSEFVDLILGKMRLNEQVAWASTCTLNTQRLSDFFDREGVIRVCKEDVFGSSHDMDLREASDHDVGVRAANKVLFFTRILPCLADRHSFQKFYLDWPTDMDAIMPSSKCGRNGGFGLRFVGNHSARSPGFCSCNIAGCSATEKEYPVLTTVEFLDIRTGLVGLDIPFFMFPSVREMYIELASGPFDELWKSDPWSRLESVTLCGGDGHIPKCLEPLKKSPRLRTVTIVLNVEGRVVSWLPDLSGFLNAYELRVGTNTRRSLRQRLAATRLTLNERDKVEKFVQNGKRLHNVEPTITLLLADISEGNVYFKEAFR